MATGNRERPGAHTAGPRIPARPASAVAKQGLGDPIADINLINSLKADLTFDQTWPVDDMANLVFDFHSVNIGSVPQFTLPVQVVADPESGGGLEY